MKKDKDTTKTQDPTAAEQAATEQPQQAAAAESSSAATEDDNSVSQDDNSGTTADTSAENAQHSPTPEDTPRDPLQEALAESAMLKDKYLRSVAEFDNYRKRTLKEKAELILNGSATAVQAMLPVLDDMERAVANAAKTDDPQVLKDGMELILQKLNKTLESLGVKKIDTTDADFNTDYHEAVAMVPGMGDDKKGKVLDCVQAGYTLNDKVIRHAKVAVGQ